MARWALLPAPAGLTLIAALGFCPALVAQSAECNPALATETEQIAQDSTITFSSVEFRNENPLTDDTRSALVKEITKLKLSVRSDEPDSDWIGQASNPVQLALLQRGYATGSVEPSVSLVRTGDREREYVLNLTIHAGTQYRLGEIRFTESTIFAAGELRAQIDLSPADLFDYSKVYDGMHEIRRMYADRGYVDQTIEPKLSVDDDHHLIDVEAKVVEGSQYHVGRVRVFGLQPGAGLTLKSRPSSGEIFERSAVDRFITENRSVLPEDVSADRDLRLDRDPLNAIVDVILDFRRACPESHAPVQSAAN